MKRVLACLFIVAVLPAMAPLHLNHESTSRAPFAATALAGHTSSSGRAECFCEVGPDGVCPCCGFNINLIHIQGDVVDDSLVQAAPSIPENRPDSGYYGSGALLLALALIAWSRILN